jgi:hypothetical protein
VPYSTLEYPRVPYSTLECPRVPYSSSGELATIAVQEEEDEDEGEQEKGREAGEGSKLESTKTISTKSAKVLKALVLTRSRFGPSCCGLSQPQPVPA